MKTIKIVRKHAKYLAAIKFNPKQYNDALTFFNSGPQPLWGHDVYFISLLQRLSFINIRGDGKERIECLKGDYIVRNEDGNFNKYTPFEFQTRFSRLAS